MHAYTGNSLIGDASTLDGRMDAMSRPMHCGFPFSAGDSLHALPGMHAWSADMFFGIPAPAVPENVCIPGFHSFPVMHA